MIPNEEKEVGIIFLLKSISTFTMVIIVVQIVFILLQQKKRTKEKLESQKNVCKKKADIEYLVKKQITEK